jgi:hypothetical protein
MAFEDRALGSMAWNVRGEPSPKGVTLSYDTANQRGLEFMFNKPLRDNRQQQDARALARAGFWTGPVGQVVRCQPRKVPCSGL